MDDLVQFIPQPAVLLSSSFLVLATNGDACRLIGCEKSATFPYPLHGKSIHDLGITLIPDQKPFFRELGSLFRAAELCAQPAYSDPRDQDWEGKTEDEQSDNDGKTSFWDDQAKRRPTHEIDVLISRKTSRAKQAPAHLQKQSPPATRARMCVHAFVLDNRLFFMVTFCRPSVNLDNYVHQAAFHGGNYEAQLLLTSPMEREINSEPFDKLIPHCRSIIDRDGQVLYLTPSWYEFTGVDNTQSLGAQWASVLHPEDVEEMLASWANVVKHSIAHWSHEARYRMRDGLYRWFYIRAQSLNDAEGRVMKWYATMLDVHESALVRMETERSRQAILRLLSQADVSLWGINQARDIYLREGALSWGPPCGQPSRNLGPEVGPNGEIDQIIMDILDGKSLVKTLEHQAADSWYRTRFVADLSPTPATRSVTDETPTVEAVLGLTIDVTDMRARADLKIENEHLVATERATRESTRLKSRFLANMSHEIRTPIAGIIGLAEILSESILTIEQLELTAGIQQSAKFLLTLINDILDFSKIESGHMDIEAIPFQPSKMISDVQVLMDVQAKEKGIELICHNNLPPDLFVIGDSERLRQVLTNLLSNSIKFTQEGSVTLSIEIRPQGDSRNRTPPDPPKQFQHHGETAQSGTSNSILLQFTVSDTGCGISRETMAKLFRPFSQADSSTARVHGGTGLGLSISRQLVELMGGEITLSSEISVGSVATVVLPYKYSTPLDSDRCWGCADDTSDATEVVTSQKLIQNTYDNTASGRPGLALEVPPSELRLMQEDTVQQRLLETTLACSGVSTSLPDRSKSLILVVEDNSVNTKVAVTNIRKLGYSVANVWNGEEALAYLDPQVGRKAPSIILMDCMMPVLDGYQATRTLRNDNTRFNEATRSIAVIAMTASAIQGDREKCEEAGMDDYLTKPVNRDALELVLQKWIVHGRGAKSWKAAERAKRVERDPN